MRHRWTSSPFAALALVTTLPTTSLAHHAMGGGTPGTFLGGLLSGLAHPVIELPHLAAILLVGMAAARLDRLAWIAWFVAGSFAGTVALTLELPMSSSETLVLLTLPVAGVLSMRTSAGRVIDALVLIAVGVVHGMAFAEPIVGAETTPIAAYLLGLAIAELVLAGLAAAGTLSLPARRPLID